MEALVGLALYASALLLLIFALLCGQNELFARTPLPRLHHFLTQGLCDATEVAARRVCGQRGGRALSAAGELCCERRNPAVQLLFLGMFGGCYWGHCRYVFPLLPLPGLPAWHKYSGSAVALLCLLAYAAACRADPGVVTAANAEALAALYPADGLLYVSNKQCGTCRLPRPARSKHCRVCGRCVARLDHHCIWLNACVGLLNMRWFLAFLLCAVLLCGYAAALGVAVLRGELRQQGVWDTAFLHPLTGNLVHLSDSPRFLLAYLSAAHGPLLGLAFFAAAAGAIVGGFLAYQLHLICVGLTTVEVQRRRVAATAAALESEAAEVEARVARALAGDTACRAAAAGEAAGAAWGGPAPATRGGGGGLACKGGRRQLHPYDRGMLRNLSEVLFPHSHLRAAAAAAKGAAAATASSGSGGLKKLV